MLKMNAGFSAANRVNTPKEIDHVVTFLSGRGKLPDERAGDDSQWRCRLKYFVDVE